MKKYLLGLFAVVFAVASIAFTKPLTVRTYVYVSSDNVIGSLNSANLIVSENWDHEADLPTFVHPGIKLAAIVFDFESAQDGGNDGQMNKAEAMAAVKAQYESSSGLPTDGFWFLTGRPLYRFDAKTNKAVITKKEGDSFLFLFLFRIFQFSSILVGTAFLTHFASSPLAPCSSV